MYVRFGKRIFDISICVVALVVIWPFLILIPILIKIFDPGPVIFSQMRVGKNGNVFRFYKFRSMPVGTGDISSDQLAAAKFTWVGEFIRRTNIDEFPQLFNILTGDMSVVGPRPPIPAQEDLLELRRLNGSLACRPGLTGLAQVSSFDGMSVTEKARYDGDYAGDLTFFGDLIIILKTFGYLLKKPPVY